MVIHILREDGLEDDVEESLLVRTDITNENDDCKVCAVEYRFPGSEVIVHRSVDVVVKRWPQGLGATLGGFS